LFSRMRAVLCGKIAHDSQLIWEVEPTRRILEMTEEPNCEVQSVWIRSTRPILAIIDFSFGTSLPCCVQSVSRKRTVFGKRNIGQQDRRKYFDTVVTPVACFGAAHRKLYKQDLPRMDIVFRRLLRSTVGPLGDLDLKWAEQLAKHELQLSGKVSANQFWSSVATLHDANECLVVRYPRHSCAYNAVCGSLTPSPQSGTGTPPKSTEGLFASVR